MKGMVHDYRCVDHCNGHRVRGDLDTSRNRSRLFHGGFHGVQRDQTIAEQEEGSMNKQVEAHFARAHVKLEE